MIVPGGEVEGELWREAVEYRKGVSLDNILNHNSKQSNWIEHWEREPQCQSDEQHGVERCRLCLEQILGTSM